MQRLNLSTGCDPLAFFGFCAAVILIILMLTRNCNSLRQFLFHVPLVTSMILPWSCWTAINKIPPLNSCRCHDTFKLTKRHYWVEETTCSLCLNTTNYACKIATASTITPRLVKSTCTQIPCDKSHRQQHRKSLLPWNFHSMSKEQLPTTREWQAMPGSKGKLNGWFNQIGYCCFKLNSKWPGITYSMAVMKKCACKLKLSTTRRWRVWHFCDSFWAFIFANLLYTSGPLLSNWSSSAPSPPVLDRALSYISVPDHECHHHKCTAAMAWKCRVPESGWALQFGHARSTLLHC